MTEAMTSTAPGLGEYFLLPSLKVDFDWMITEFASFIFPKIKLA